MRENERKREHIEKPSLRVAGEAAVAVVVVVAAWI